MKKHSHIIAACILLLMMYTSKYKAQLSGVYTIPGSYASIAAAITDLNLPAGVSGAVTVNIAAGYTETAPVGGFVLNTIVGASATNSIVIRKNGAGANPLITAYTGTATPASVITDGVWSFIGTDYVTIDGIDITDPNAANPATMDYAYGFFKASAANGCQYNTIKNCTITLNRVNNASGSGPSLEGSKAINLVNTTFTAQTTAVTVTVASGANSFNKFYSNVIQNCNMGVSLYGFTGTSPFAFSDYGNDVGGTSLATGNTIINYGGGGTANAASGVVTFQQYDVNISFNVINSNNGSGVNHAAGLRGIFLANGDNTNVTILSNTISLKGGGTTQTIEGITNSAGTNGTSNLVNMSNNLLTGFTYASATSGPTSFVLNTTSPSSLTINNNTVTNNSSAATSGAHNFVGSTGAVVKIANITNNSINTFSFTGATQSGAIRPITSAAAATTMSAAVTGNTIQSVTFATAASGVFSSIFMAGTGAYFNVSSNRVVNLNVPTTGNLFFINESHSTPNILINDNVIVGSMTKTGAGGIFYGHYNFGSPTSGTCTITNNNFSNIVLTGATAFYGIYHATGTGQTYSISSNTVTNITGGSSTGYGIYSSYALLNNINNNTINNIFTTTGTIYGIGIGTTSSSTLNVNNNSVSTLTSSGSAIIYGYDQQAANITNLFKNKFYDFNGGGTASTVYGISLPVGSTANVYNNLIGDLKAPTTSAANSIIGISLTGGATHNVYYNSVYLNATSSGANFGTSAISVNATPTTINLRNNIFINNSTAAGTGSTVAFRKSSTSLTNYVTTSNNNLFYAGTPGASNLIFSDGTNASQTLAAYKALMGTRDGASVTQNITFVSTVGTSANFLNVSPSVPTQIEGAAGPIATVTDDYAGTIRNATTPDIGAWEGNYILLDINPPAIGQSGFTTGPCSLTGRTFTATLSDLSGVAGAALAPRIYFTVNAGTYTSVAGTLASGTATNGVWSFNLVYSAAVTNTISYFVVAQDGAASSNLTAFPSTGFAGTDVNTVSTPPTTPNSYIINSIGGVYLVGATGTFTSLTDAAFAYNNYCLTSAVTFSLIDALYSTAETFPIIFRNNVGASATNSLLIRPAAGLTVAITPTSTSMTAALKFLDAQYITVDGINASGSALVINNSNTSSTSSNIWLASSGVGNKFISIKNTSIIGGSFNNSQGIVACIEGALPSLTGGADNDNITIQGNSVVRVFNGIAGVGAASVSAGGLDNWLISANVVGPAAFGTDNIAGSGIALVSAVNPSVIGNAVRNCSTTTFAISGININANVTGFVVSQNTVSGYYTNSTSSSGISSIGGMYLGTSVVNGTVSYNNISRIENTATGGYGARGMIVNTGNMTSNIKIHNNFISDIVSYGDGGIGLNDVTFSPLGIAITGCGGLDVDYNSINLFGSHPGLTGVVFSADFSIEGSSANLNVRNNIFANTYDNSTATTDVPYAVYCRIATTCFTSMNYNNYYVGGVSTLGALSMANGANYPTLVALQSAFGLGQNLNSLNFQPQFTSTTDLHLLATAVTNAGINNMASPLAGLTLDIDGQTRSATVPDIGADEFTATGTCTSAVGGTLAPASGSFCTTQTVLATPNGVSAGLGTSYQWKVSSTSGGSYTNIAVGTTTNPTYFSVLSSFAPGVYYVVLQASCASPALTGLSNESTVTVVAPPTTSISSTSSLVCQGGTATLTASGATTYLWNTSATTTVITSSPSAAVPFTVTGSNGVCAVSATYNLAYSPNPTVIPSSSGTVVCANAQATLSATGANTYSWTNVGSGATVTPTQSVATTYTVVGTNTAGCVSAPATISLATNPSPTVSLSGSSGICTGQTASVLATGSGLTYLWNTGATTSSITDSPTSNTVYVVTINNGTCSASYSQAVSVAASLLISIAGSPTVCNGSAITLTASGGVTYTWTSGPNTANYTVSPSSNITYTVTGASGTCSNTATKSVTVVALPSLTVTGNTTVCAGSSTTLTASGANTYTWNTSPIGTVAIAAAPTSTTSYTVTGTSTLGCSSFTTVTVNTNTVPVITIASSATAVCVSSTATLTASGASTYSWVSGPQTAVNTVTPTGAATYTVNGTNAAGCISSKTVALGSYTLPVVTIAPTSAIICLTSTGTFVASGASTYTWNASASNTLATYTVVPTGNTVYTVVATTTAGCVGQQTVGVTTNTLPVMVITPPSVTVCTNDFASVTASGASTYTWDVTGSQNPSTSFYQPASSTHTVTGTSPQGCKASATVSVLANPLPTLAVTPSFTTVCASTPINFNVTGASTYTWTGSVTGASVTLTPTASISYSVAGTTTDGCTAGTQVVVVTNTLPVLGISPSNATVCSTSPVILTATGANTYVWNGTINTSTASFSPATSTVYTVVGTSTANSCSSSKTVAVTVNALPTITITASSASICIGNSSTLTASGASTYAWNDGTGVAAVVVSPIANTNYTVTGTDANGCVSSKTTIVSVWQSPTLATSPASQTICAGTGGPDNVGTYTATGASTYTWIPSNSSANVFTASPTTSSPYTLTGTDANGCMNSINFILTVDKCTGLNENSLNSHLISIYPNPSNGKITTDFGFEGNKNIVIMNSVGALITNLTTSNSTESFDLSTLAKGVYFIRISSKQASGNYKVVIE